MRSVDISASRRVVNFLSIVAILLASALQAAHLCASTTLVKHSNVAASYASSSGKCLTCLMAQPSGPVSLPFALSSNLHQTIYVGSSAERTVSLETPALGPRAPPIA